VADLDFGPGNLETQSGVLAERVGKGGAGRGGADDIVALEADAVDLDAAGLEVLDDRDGSVGLLGDGLEAVVGVVELDVLVGGGGGAEGDRDVLRADGPGKDGVAVARGAVVVVDGLVDNVPSVANAFEVGDDVGDVGLHHSDERVVGPAALLD
jgi:hypothetical protein